MECGNCHTMNAPGVQTCVGCGWPLGQAPPPDPGGSAPPAQPPPGQGWGPAPGYGQQPPAPDPGAYPPPAPGGYPPPAPAPTPRPIRAATPPAAIRPGATHPPPRDIPRAPASSSPRAATRPGPPAPTRRVPIPAVRAAPRPRRARARPLFVILAILVVLALGVGAFLVLSGDDKGEEVVLEPVGMVQEDDFAGNLDVGDAAGAVAAADLSAVPDPTTEQVGTPLAGRVAQGGEPALYGGSRDTQVCDVEQLVAFLTDPANADKAAAWSDVLGVDAAGIPDYVAGLTAVRLRYDTRVTNHGFQNGEANPFQSLLEAGTAVLVDNTGVPRVKCNCGNPLAEPTPLEGTSEGDAMSVDSIAENPDDAWEGLDPATAVKVEPADAAFDEVTLVDFTTAGLIQRPIGSDGASKPDTGTGDVQVTLEWASDSDLDLHVTEPDGTEIYYLDTGADEHRRPARRRLQRQLREQRRRRERVLAGGRRPDGHLHGQRPGLPRNPGRRHRLRRWRLHPHHHHCRRGTDRDRHRRRGRIGRVRVPGVTRALGVPPGHPQPARSGGRAEQLIRGGEHAHARRAAGTHQLWIRRQVPLGGGRRRRPPRSR